MSAIAPPAQHDECAGHRGREGGEHEPRRARKGEQQRRGGGAERGAWFGLGFGLGFGFGFGFGFGLGMRLGLGEGWG